MPHTTAPGRRRGLECGSRTGTRQTVEQQLLLLLLLYMYAHTHDARCRDVACDVQVQRMYVGVTSCRHCQVLTRTGYYYCLGVIICIWYGRTLLVTVTKWTPRGKRDASVKMDSTDLLWYIPVTQHAEHS